LFAEEISRVPPGEWVVVDEVQRLPQLLNEVHRAIEERKLKFALLGSSAKKLRKEGVNLLGGRALLRTMYPLLPMEMGQDYSLEEAMRIGTLPVILASESPGEQLESYVRLYLKEEIQAEALVRNLPGFARFLPIAALFHGQSINLAGLARDAGVARTTAEGYLKILEDTLLGFRLPGFEPKLRVKERVHPKWYWIDAGVARAAKGTLGPPSPEERGALFEGIIATLLRAGKDLKFCEYDRLSYWSPPGGKVEVDFVIERGKERIAIEVKTAREPSSSHLTGLRAIADLKGLGRRILVYPGPHNRKTEDGIEITGFLSFIEEHARGLV
jgi:predicted AAA+ superfamily ATPase